MGALPSSFSNYAKYIPLYMPAVKEESCEVDDNLLSERVKVIFFTTLAATVFNTALVTVVPNAIVLIPVSVLSCLLLSPLDVWQAQNAAINKAIQEYCQEAYPPSHAATKQIVSSLKAACLFISQQNHRQHLNKKDAEGYSLLDLISSSHFSYGQEDEAFEIYKLFIEKGFDIKQPSELEDSYFMRAVKDKNVRYIKCLLETKKIKAEDFSATEQVRVWTKVNCLDSFALLKKYGFNINAQDNLGQTPLLREIYISEKTNFRELDVTAIVGNLLKLGANPTLKGSFEFHHDQIKQKLELNAFELNARSTHLHKAVIASLLNQFKQQ